MTRSAKIGLLVISIAGLVFLSVAGAMVYFAISFGQGMKLANEGYAAIARHDYDTAISRFNAALQKTLGRNARASVYLNRGTAFNFKRRFDESIRDHTEALRLDPGLGDAYTGRGWAFQQKGQNDKAIADLTEAISRDQNS